MAAPPVVSPNAARPVPRLIGTVVLAGGASFAICQLDPQPPRVMRVGDRLGDFVLERVTQGSVLFVTPDSSRTSGAARAGSPATRRDSVLLRVPKAGAP